MYRKARGEKKSPKLDCWMLMESCNGRWRKMSKTNRASELCEKSTVCGGLLSRDEKVDLAVRWSDLILCFTRWPSTMWCIGTSRCKPVSVSIPSLVYEIVHEYCMMCPNHFLWFFSFSHQTHMNHLLVISWSCWFGASFSPCDFVNHATYQRAQRRFTGLHLKRFEFRIGPRLSSIVCSVRVAPCWNRVVLLTWFLFRAVVEEDEAVLEHLAWRVWKEPRTWKSESLAKVLDPVVWNVSYLFVFFNPPPAMFCFTFQNHGESCFYCSVPIWIELFLIVRASATPSDRLESWLVIGNCFFFFQQMRIVVSCYLL